MATGIGILGYTDRFSYRPGDKVRAYFSAEDGSRSYTLQTIRLTAGNDGRRSASFGREAVTSIPSMELPAIPQQIHAGSYVRVDRCPEISFDDSLSVVVLIRPTLPQSGRRQAIVVRREKELRDGFGLTLAADGAPEVWVECRGHEEGISGAPLRADNWYLIVASIDPKKREVALDQYPLGGTHRFEDAVHVSRSITHFPKRLHPGRLYMAAAENPDNTDPRDTIWHFDGRIEAPALYKGELTSSGLKSIPLESVPKFTGSIICRWDFSQDLGSPRVRAVGLPSADGVCVNLPTRAVAGASWHGETTDWRQRPDQYAAIHFHRDDLEDCHWNVSAELTLPEGLRSGIYALRAETEKGTADHVPFFVLPPKGGPTARLAFLASTFTYLAYANSHHGYEDPLSEPAYGGLLVLSPIDLFLNTRRDLGTSLYDRHLDGSGGCVSSWKRPILNMRPDGRLWNFAADLHIIGWLEALGFEYDVITDDVLHEGGANVIEPYACVITGSHPEYHSRATLDALGRYLGQGGRMFYAGGNGFYWKVATSRHHPGCIEVRRGETGTRCFETPAGERHHQFDGEFGGLWRANGMPPQSLVGIGFVAEGFDACSYFLRTEASRDNRAAFIFDGVGIDERIGDFGLLGGAAGLELDASEPSLGTPSHALILARSVEHSNVYLVTPEVMVSAPPYIDAISNPLARAEMAFFETPAGGAVFSTGSISWVTSLAHADYQNNVSRISANVIRRFLDPVPFTRPKTQV